MVLCLFSSSSIKAKSFFLILKMQRCTNDISVVSNVKLDVFVISTYLSILYIGGFNEPLYVQT